MAVDDAMNGAALARAKAHVEVVASFGSEVTLIKAATKDQMGTILTEDTQVLNAHPVRFSPFERIVMERISWAENVGIIFLIQEIGIDRCFSNLHLIITAA